MISCEVDAQPGHCTPSCETSNINYGIDALEPRRGSACKHPNVCCPDDRESSRHETLCLGTCAKTCSDLQSIDYGEGAIEFRRTPSNTG